VKCCGRVPRRKRDPGHFVDLADDLKVMGIVPLGRLPVTRETRAKPTTRSSGRAGRMAVRL
jgi:hypothetical protein